MDTVKDFLKHINQRISSPYIFSFIISWVLCNWPVTVGLFLYDAKMLKVDGFRSYIVLIDTYVTFKSGVLIPFLMSTMYVLFNPIISNAIQIFVAWADSVGETLKLTVSKDGKISIDKYLILREDLMKKRKVLIKIIEDEKGTIGKLAEKETELLSVKSLLNELDKKNTNTEAALNSQIQKNDAAIKELSDLRMVIRITESIDQYFSGEWICEYQFIDNKTNNVVQNAEKFLIDKEVYHVNRKPEFMIQSTRCVTETFLEFEKVRFINKKEIIKVKLLKISPVLWIGYELGATFKYSLVRYYPINIKPDEAIVMLPFPLRHDAFEKITSQINIVRSI